MKPTIRIAQRACEAAKARQAVYKPKVALGHYVDCLTWERALAELSGGEYDGVLGLRVFVDDLLARIAELEAEVEKGREAG